MRIWLALVFDFVGRFEEIFVEISCAPTQQDPFARLKLNATDRSRRQHRSRGERGRSEVADEFVNRGGNELRVID
jgi:hypothetical protein